MKSDKENISHREFLINSISKQFNGALLLKKDEASRILNRSVVSLDRDRRNSRGPSYHKSAEGNVYYSVTSLVDFILKEEITINSH